jgi:hypothetical protein
LAGEQSFESTHHYKKLLASHKLKKLEYQPLQATAVPQYVFLMTTQVNLKMIMNALTPSKIRHEYFHHIAPAVPSSTLIFEVGTNAAGEMVVNAKFNDEYIPLGGCYDNYTPCQVPDFISYLENFYTDDIVAACNAVEEDVHTIELVQ